MKRQIIGWVAVALLVVGLGSVAYGDCTETITVASWNIRGLGASTPQSRLDALANTISAFDIVALQEIQADEGLEALVRTLQARAEIGTAEDWSYVSSSAYVPPNVELYAFVYRSDLLDHVTGPEGVYPVTTPEDFSRPPFFTTFRSRVGGFDFTLITVHITYAEPRSLRTAECERLAAVWASVQALSPAENDLILLGDFNRDGPTHEGFHPLLQMGIVPLLTREDTLTTSASWYDNIWIDPRFTETELSGVLGVGPQDCNSYGEACPDTSMQPSDHCAVFAGFCTAFDDDPYGLESYSTVLDFHDIDFTTGEITLRNLTDQVISLFGWRLSDEEGWYIFPIGSTVEPSGNFVLTEDEYVGPHGTRGFFLRKDSEEVFLYPPGGQEPVSSWITE